VSRFSYRRTPSLLHLVLTPALSAHLAAQPHPLREEVTVLSSTLCSQYCHNVRLLSRRCAVPDNNSLRCRI
jgi:hypothetical protein